MNTRVRGWSLVITGENSLPLVALNCLTEKEARQAFNCSQLYWGAADLELCNGDVIVERRRDSR